MTDKELQDFIDHGVNGFREFSLLFGGTWASQAVVIAKEYQARLAQPDCVCGEPDSEGVHRKDKPCYMPQKKEWVGLTDEEIKDAWSQLWYDLNNGKFAATDDPSRHTNVMFARALEAKLKEKNNAT